MARYKEEQRLDELYENGQITHAEKEVGQLKLIMQDEIDMLRKDGMKNWRGRQSKNCINK